MFLEIYFYHTSFHFRLFFLHPIATGKFVFPFPFISRYFMISSLISSPTHWFFFFLVAFYLVSMYFNFSFFSSYNWCLVSYCSGLNKMPQNDSVLFKCVLFLIPAPGPSAPEENSAGARVTCISEGQHIGCGNLATVRELTCLLYFTCAITSNGFPLPAQMSFRIWTAMPLTFVMSWNCNAR